MTIKVIASTHLEAVPCLGVVVYGILILLGLVKQAEALESLMNQTTITTTIRKMSPFRLSFHGRIHITCPLFTLTTTY